MDKISISLDRDVWETDLIKLKNHYKAGSYAEIVRLGLNKLMSEIPAESC